MRTERKSTVTAAPVQLQRDAAVWGGSPICRVRPFRSKIHGWGLQAKERINGPGIIVDQTPLEILRDVDIPDELLGFVYDVGPAYTVGLPKGAGMLANSADDPNCRWEIWHDPQTKWGYMVDIISVRGFPEGAEVTIGYVEETT